MSPRNSRLDAIVASQLSRAKQLPLLFWCVVRRTVCAQAAAGKNGAAGAASDHQFDYDLVIIGCGVGGHGAGLHAVECVSRAAADSVLTVMSEPMLSGTCMEGGTVPDARSAAGFHAACSAAAAGCASDARLLQGLKVAIIEGHDIGGTCVNRGCVPSKALLAASNNVRQLRNEHHLKTLGIQLNGATATFDRQAIADHATNLAATVQGNLARSLESIGVVSSSGVVVVAVARVFGGRESTEQREQGGPRQASHHVCVGGNSDIASCARSTETSAIPCTPFPHTDHH